jgi:hypothetical protein
MPAIILKLKPKPIASGRPGTAPSVHASAWPPFGGRQRTGTSGAMCGGQPAIERTGGNVGRCGAKAVSNKPLAIQ